MEAKKPQYGISLQAFIPVRLDPYERSEMITQIIFGETVEIIDDEGKWLYIKLLFDNYEGWVDKKCIRNVEEHFLTDQIVIKNCIKARDLNSGIETILPIGATFPKPTSGKFSFGLSEFELITNEGYTEIGSCGIDELIPHVLSIPYIWGGRSGHGFDCSGLTQYLCRASGRPIPRDASEQAGVGETLSFLNEVETGDLAFFDDIDGMIHHVGMFIGNDRLIHASGVVKIDRIDHQGIYSEMEQRYTHKLRVVKRVK